MPKQFKLEQSSQMGQKVVGVTKGISTMSTVKVEYELDQWEWQGTTRSIEVDPADFEGLSAEEIKQRVYEDIRSDAEQNLHLVYAEDDVAQEILTALENGDEHAEEND